VSAGGNRDLSSKSLTWTEGIQTKDNLFFLQRRFRVFAVRVISPSPTRDFVFNDVRKALQLGLVFQSFGGC